MCLKYCWKVANSVDPDQTPHIVASDLGLHCLLRPICPNIILVNIVQSWDIEGHELASVDIPSRDSIHQYQCDNPFII